MRKLMRLVVTDGFGKTAEVPGYYPGGKTGTAEKVAAHGGYSKHANVAAFMSVFPMNAPRYAVYMMLDEPHGEQEHAWLRDRGLGDRAGGRQGDRADRRRCWACCRTSQDMPPINQALAIPLQPGRPPGAVGRGAAVASTRRRRGWRPRELPPNRPQPAYRRPMLPPAISRPAPRRSAGDRRRFRGRRRHRPRHCLQPGRGSRRSPAFRC